MTTSLAPSLLYSIRLGSFLFLFGLLIMRRACKNGRILAFPPTDNRENGQRVAWRDHFLFSRSILRIIDSGPAQHKRDEWTPITRNGSPPPRPAPNPVSSPPHTSEMRHDRHERIIDNILRSSQMLPRWRHHKSLSLLRELKQTEELRGGVHSSC